MNDLEALLDAVEQPLDGLARALIQQDAAAIERHAAVLHGALTNAVAGFSLAAREGRVTPELRQRLIRASMLVAAQRESLARATAALDRAIDVLIPAAKPTGLYGVQGIHRQTRSGYLQA